MFPTETPEGGFGPSFNETEEKETPEEESQTTNGTQDVAEEEELEEIEDIVFSMGNTEVIGGQQ
jgi:hypothetical protein